jgi:hypothetical protein
MPTGNEFFWKQIKKYKGTRNAWVWPSVVNIIQSLKKVDKTQFFTKELSEDQQQTWTVRAMRLLKYSRDVPGDNELTINYASIDDLMNDLFTMWLDGTHDDYLDMTFKEFITQGLSTSTGSPSYIRAMRLIPDDLLRQILGRLSTNLPNHMKKTMKAAALLVRNSNVKATGNFEGKIKRDIRSLIGDAHYISVNPTEGIQVIDGHNPCVTIDQQSDFGNISKFLNYSAEYLEPASLAEQLVDPGAELVTFGSSLSVIQGALAGDKQSIAIFYARPKINFTFQGSPLYSIQISDISQRAVSSAVPRFEETEMMQYKIVSALGGKHEINVGMSAAGAKKNTEGRGRNVIQLTPEQQAKNKFAKLSGDRMQILSVLYYNSKGFDDIILASGDMMLLVQHINLFNLVNASMPRNKKLDLTFIFDLSRKYQLVNGTFVSNRNYYDGQIMFFGSEDRFVLLGKNAVSRNLVPRASTRSTLLKNLRKNIFTSFNGPNNPTNTVKYKNVGNIVRITRGVLKNIKKRRPNLANKVNNIKKKNCDPNGNPITAPRRRAQKNITRMSFGIARQTKLLTQNNVKAMTNSLIRYINEQYNKTVPLSANKRAKYNYTFCKGRGLASNQVRAHTRATIFRMPQSVAQSSGTNAFGGMNYSNGNIEVSSSKRRRAPNEMIFGFGNNNVGSSNNNNPTGNNRVGKKPTKR